MGLSPLRRPCGIRGKSYKKAAPPLAEPLYCIKQLHRRFKLPERYGLAYNQTYQYKYGYQQNNDRQANQSQSQNAVQGQNNKGRHNNGVQNGNDGTIGRSRTSAETIRVRAGSGRRHRHHSMVMRKTMEHHGSLLSVECWAYFIAAKRKCQQGDTGQNG